MSIFNFLFSLFHFRRRRGGFTLVELIVVIALIGLLVTAGFASYINSMRSTRDSKRKTDLEKIRAGLELYRSDNGAYANVTAGNAYTYLRPALSSPTPYINADQFPNDPRSNLNYYYYYQRNYAGGGNNTYRICAYLEAPKADDPPCPGGSISCGVANCNYGLSQP